MDVWEFQRRYPDLHNFLGGCFPDADLEGLGDTEIAEEFALLDSDASLRRRVLEQGELLLALEPFPWEAVRDEANRHFTGPEGAREWLQSILLTVRRASGGGPEHSAGSTGESGP
jgi:hypothetical protein